MLYRGVKIWHGLVYSNIAQTLVEVQFRPQEDIQLTSKPPRIHWHNGKLDPSLLNNQNWFRENQDMVFCMTVKANIITRLAEFWNTCV